MYLANLEINSVNSRTLRIGNFEQARRDYEHMVSIAPEHALAHYCLFKAYNRLESSEKAQKTLSRLKKIVKTSEVQANYIKLFNISLD